MIARRRQRIAVHEAGHAVSAVILGVPIRYATIRQTRDYSGGVKLPGKVAAFPFAVIAGSGMAAEIAAYRKGTAVTGDDFLGCVRDFRKLKELRAEGVNVELAITLAGSIHGDCTIAETVQHVAAMLCAPKPLRRIAGEEIETVVVERLQLADDRSQRRELARSALIELTGRAA